MSQPLDVEALDEGLVCLTVPAPDAALAPFDRPTRVYLLRSPEGCTLINTGHPDRQDLLLSALADIEVRPEDITRVVATGHAPERAAAASAFPRADLFAAHAGEGEPWSGRSQVTFARLMRCFEALRDPPEDARLPLDPEHLDPAPLAALEREHLVCVERPIIPLRDGMRVNLSGVLLRVLETPGCGPGELALFEPERGWLFTGVAAQDAHEACWIDDAGALLGALGVLFDLEAAQIMPAHGAPSASVSRELRRTSLFINNFLSNIPYAISGPTSAPELVQQDLGLAPVGDELVLYLASVLGYHALCEELLKTGVIESAGDGIFRRYGVDMPESNPLRKRAREAPVF